MRPTRRFSRAAWLGFFVAVLVAQGACGGSVEIESAGQCSDDSFSIDLTEMEEANIGHDAEERFEQLRDWLWPLLLARLEATTELEGLLIGSATQPLIRDDALAHVLDLPVGSTRAGIARDGTVVVMVQDGDDAAMQEAVLEAIDQEATHLGRTPRQVVVYRYAINERGSYAHLCPLGTFDADWIENRKHGFRGATVRTVSELESFLDGGVDLLSAQCTRQGLEVTGRSRPRARKAPITVEHVAALDPPAVTSYVPLADLGGYPTLSPEESEWVLTVARVIQGNKLAQVKKYYDRETRDMMVDVHTWQAQHPDVPIEHLVLSWTMQNNEDQSIGFSLDPRLRAGDAANDLEMLMDALQDPTTAAALLYAWKAAPTKAAPLWLTIQHLGALPENIRERLLALQQELAVSSDHEALGVLTKAAYQGDTPDDSLVATVASFVKEHSAYQCARYDGPLQGTLTGMTMFYTDLLMKLWSIDPFDSAPEGLIPGFESVVAHELSSAYCTEEENKYPSTRAWLGLREEQYVRQGAERVRFAPVVTRVFARGSQYGTEYGEEFEANAAARRFHRWWNTHYARVAAWEPQYELLNQIMKWSVVTQAGALSEHEDCLGFLDQVPVDRSQRFDQWVDKHEELRWRGPVPLVQRDDEPTECMPILRSSWSFSCGSDGYMTGGVTAASKATIASKPVAQPSRPPQFARLDAMSSKAPSKSYSGRLTYDSIARSDGTLRNVEIDPARRSFQARVDAGQSQRGARHRYATSHRDEQQPVAGLKNERSLHHRKLVASDTLNAHKSTLGVAHLHADDVTGTILRPRVTPGPTTQMHAIGDGAAARLADGKKPLFDVGPDLPGVSKKSLSDVAPDLPGVTNAYRVADDTVLVELSPSVGGSLRYGLMSSGDGNRGPPGLLMGRYGGPGNQGVKVEITLMSNEAAQSMLAKATKLPSQRQALFDPVTKALDAGDVARAERAIVDHMGRGGHPAAVTEVLARARRRAIRLRMDTRAIEALQLRTSIKYGKPRGSVREHNVLPADGTDFLVPRSHANIYADLANLPPGQNPALRPGEPRAAFSARAVGASPALSDVPRVVHVDGVDYVRLQRPGAMARGVRRTTYIVEPCRRPDEDESSATVECLGRMRARQVEEGLRQYLRSQACRNEKLARKYGVTDCMPSTANNDRRGFAGVLRTNAGVRSLQK